MSNFFLDTESIGIYGPTILIQWAIDDGPINIHNIFKEPVYKTLRLIELMCDHTVIGFNLSHDSFHINRTYGILKQLPPMSIPTALDIADWENDPASHDDWCVKPKNCIDYLVLGKKSVFQSVMKQKDIVLRKVPRLLAPKILQKLKEDVTIPDIYFSKNKKVRGVNWRIMLLKNEGDGTVSEELQVDIEDLKFTDLRSVNLKKYEEKHNITFNKDFVNIKLSFNPSAALKNIVEHITGDKQTTIEDLAPFRKPKEYSYFPTLGTWAEVADEHIWGWSNDPQRIKYAKNDIHCLRIVKKYYKEQGIDVEPIDTDSELAWAIGCNFWKGFAVDLPRIKKQHDQINEKLEKYKNINFNAPKWVLNYLYEKCSPLEQQGIKNTKVETLQNITKDPDWKEDNPELVERCELILELRHIYKERDLYTKLLAAKRLYVQFKVIGTKSNRMSGGGESFISTKGSISPQGINKKPEVRACFPLADEDFELSGGDFDGFEVSIAEAEYNDPELRRDLLSGKKIHALFAEAMYNIDYDTILLGKELEESHPEAYYSRGKKGFLGKLYGAQDKKMEEVLWLNAEQIWKGLKKFFTRYKGVEKSQQITYNDHQALVQAGGRGTAIVWKEPKEYVESFLGFRRYFTLEYNICKSLFNMAQELHNDKEFKNFRGKVTRTDRVQTIGGAAQSAIYAAAFNIQAQIMRSAVNHKIQSPGGQLTKEMEYRIWNECQPIGCHKLLVMLFNIHDELMVPHVKKLRNKIKDIVNKFIEEKKSIIPLLSMTWKTNLKHWGEK